MDFNFKVISLHVCKETNSNEMYLIVHCYSCSDAPSHCGMTYCAAFVLGPLIAACSYIQFYNYMVIVLYKMWKIIRIKCENQETKFVFFLTTITFTLLWLFCLLYLSGVLLLLILIKQMLNLVHQVSHLWLAVHQHVAGVKSSSTFLQQLLQNRIFLQIINYTVTL